MCIKGSFRRKGAKKGGVDPGFSFLGSHQVIYNQYFTPLIAKQRVGWEVSSCTRVKSSIYYMIL